MEEAAAAAVVPNWIRAFSPLEFEIDDLPPGAPVCAADDPDIEKVYRALAFWHIPFSAVPQFVDRWFQLPRARRAELADTVRAFYRELHPDTCVDSAAERDDAVVFAAWWDGSSKKEEGSSSILYGLRNNRWTAAATTTKTIAKLARAGAVRCLRHTNNVVVSASANDQDNWLREALTGGNVEVAEYLLKSSVRLTRMRSSDIESTIRSWVVESAMRSGSTAMLDWLYCLKNNRFEPVEMQRLWNAACVATTEPTRFAALIHWIEARAKQSFRAYFAENCTRPGDTYLMWQTPVHVDNVAAFDLLTQHCGWNVSADLLHGLLWHHSTRVATTINVAKRRTTHATAATLLLPQVVVWLVARAKAAGVRLRGGYAAMVLHGGLVAARWLREQGVADWHERGGSTYTAAVLASAAVPATMALLDWLDTENCPLTLVEHYLHDQHYLNDPIVVVLKQSVGPDQMRALLERLLVAANMDVLPYEYARSLAMHVFVGRCGRCASNGRPEGTVAPACLDWICSRSGLLVALQTDPLLYKMAAEHCMLYGNLAAAQWLIDVARVPPFAFHCNNLFPTNVVDARAKRVAAPRAVMQWLSRVGGCVSVPVALVAAIEAQQRAPPASVRWLLRRLCRDDLNAPITQQRMGRAAIVASNLPALKRVFRAEKATGACTEWRAPLILARLAGRYASLAMLRWLYGNAATKRNFQVYWRAEALITAALYNRTSVVRWMLGAKYALRSKHDPVHVLDARELCKMLRMCRTELDYNGSRSHLLQWMCSFFGWTETEAEVRVLGGE